MTWPEDKSICFAQNKCVKHFYLQHQIWLFTKGFQPRTQVFPNKSLFSVSHPQWQCLIKALRFTADESGPELWFHLIKIPLRETELQESRIYSSGSRLLDQDPSGKWEMKQLVNVSSSSHVENGVNIEVVHFGRWFVKMCTAEPFCKPSIQKSQNNTAIKGKNLFGGH